MGEQKILRFTFDGQLFLTKKKGIKMLSRKIRELFSGIIALLLILIWSPTASGGIPTDQVKEKADEIIRILNEFYDDYLAKMPDTYFGGIRTEKDLDYKAIGWYA